MDYSLDNLRFSYLLSILPTFWNFPSDRRIFIYGVGTGGFPNPPVQESGVG
ncbi:hypothetical protein [Chroococcidiopsis sp. CCALA 051]|uniref:hypothetical protein n=1 Tax=Chroococcidiopsis sp. CCALA 051 TaxID=869949 RepID=UPI001304CBA6|nr:hypothetical protein [Chroococcidiopsis sp. CCALA 051]